MTGSYHTGLTTQLGEEESNLHEQLQRLLSCH